MSDLQCPARLLVVSRPVSEELVGELAGQRVSTVAGSTEVEQLATALQAAARCDPRFDEVAGFPCAAEDLADLTRGEAALVLTGLGEVCGVPVGSRGWVELQIDDDGWGVRPVSLDGAEET